MKSYAFTSLILMATFLSPAKASELTTEQENNPAFGEGPILMKPTAADPLSYHGTLVSYEWGAELHSFWLYPAGSSLESTSWDTYDSAKFCTNFVKAETDNKGRTRFIC